MVLLPLSPSSPRHNLRQHYRGVGVLQAVMGWFWSSKKQEADTKPEDAKPKKKICCACPETKVALAECL